MKIYFFLIIMAISSCAKSYQSAPMSRESKIERTASICCELMKKYRNNPNNEGGNESVVLSDMWLKGMHGVEWTSCDKVVFLSYLIRCYGPLNKSDLRELAEHMNEGDAEVFGRIIEQYESGAHERIGCESGVKLSNQAAGNFITALRELISLRNQIKSRQPDRS